MGGKSAWNSALSLFREPIKKATQNRVAFFCNHRTTVHFRRGTYAHFVVVLCKEVIPHIGIALLRTSDEAHPLGFGGEFFANERFA